MHLECLALIALSQSNSLPCRCTHFVPCGKSLAAPSWVRVITPGPSLLHALNQLALQDHWFWGFPSLLLQWQSGVFSGVGSCQLLPALWRSIEDQREFDLPEWSQEAKPGAVLPRGSKILGQTICITTFQLPVFTPDHCSQAKKTVPDRKTKPSRFSRVSFLYMAGPLTEPIMMSPGFLRSNKAEFSLVFLLCKLWAPSVLCSTNSHTQARYFYLLFWFVQRREQGSSPQKTGSKVIKTLHNLYILTNKHQHSIA